MYKYSIIIPHKNTPTLLQRCLDSIPVREDVQLIIVDDNSDTDKVQFPNFPGKNRANTTIIFSKGEQGKGPGFARNLGLIEAKGKWIIFADADDYFNAGFEQLLDQYKEAEQEIIFFKCSAQDESGVLKNEYPLVNQAIDKARREKDGASIVYGVPLPWGKFIKRNFVEKNNIKFQEIVGGDDILFSMQMAVLLKHFALEEERLYCVVDRPGSLTRKTNWKGFYSYAKACIHAYILLLNVQKQELAAHWLVAWWGFLWTENKYKAIQLLPRIFIYLSWKDAKKVFLKGMKTGAWNWKNNEV